MKRPVEIFMRFYTSRIEDVENVNQVEDLDQAAWVALPVSAPGIADRARILPFAQDHKAESLGVQAVLAKSCEQTFDRNFSGPLPPGIMIKEH
ncbi:hypothetical protein [uncultured Nitratireductor sp.]|uniref:hypothetical protein n=1 Tax=uncultured Nitratireductor sp. TaxID=520953 RepID=UPI0025DA6096|nr:hypothetical protein [uncultured Nitratireductor sp.]